MPIMNFCDDSNKIQARKGQEDPWIMYLIVRESLNMTPGKIAAQVGHAVGIIDVYYMSFVAEIDMMYLSAISEDIFATKIENCISLPEKERLEKFLLPKTESFEQWKNNSFRKIVLRADDKEWEKAKRQLDCYLVVDAGLTQVETGSETVIGLWPMLKSSVPPLVKRLRLL